MSFRSQARLAFLRGSVGGFEDPVLTAALLAREARSYERAASLGGRDRQRGTGDWEVSSRTILV